MSEIKRWSGNDTTEKSFSSHKYEKLINFAKKYEHVYLFGNGCTGSAIYKFLRDACVKIEGIITSDDFKHKKMDKIGADSMTAIIVGVADKWLDEVMPIIKKCFSSDRIFIPDISVRETLAGILGEKFWREKFWINVYVTNKCNLGCRSCSAFAPICEQDFYELDQFKKDMVRIQDMGFDVINTFKFTGAEAMLHPDIIEMLAYTRELFPDSKIELYTNGLFIKGCSSEKLKALSELSVILVITEYPVSNLDLRESYKRLDKCNVSYCVIYAEGQKYFSKRPLRFEKDVPKEKYIECPRYKMCKSLFLFRGRLYKCIYALSANYVNKAFDKNLMVTDDDYVDIYNSDTEDVFEYATRRIPFCGYCSPIEESVPWGISERKIEEWT